MDKDWLQVRKIFDDALRQKPEERARFVKEVCGSNKTLQTEVESLLSSLGSADSFMETPAVAKVADAIEAEQRKIAPGTCFGHYEVIKQIGAGGMGEVYLAQDKKLDRQVAIKILNEKFSGQESNLLRFIKEAKAASALNHPNILTIYEFGEAEDTHFIVSEFVEGNTLRENLRQSKLKLAEILDISIQIAGALSAAHKAHLIHRDIKPENIMIRPDGYVKILDFGLAKLIQPKQPMVGLEAETAQQSETAKGVIMGTVNYMSPEQAKGERVDERTDIFSFGVVIYEMLTSKTPFQGNSVSETFANLINAEPQSLEQVASNVPAELEHIVLKMLRKERDERYSSMNRLSADLKNLQENLKSQGKLEKSPLSENETRTEIMAVDTGETKNLTLRELREQTGDVELASTNQGLKRKSKYRTLAVVGLILALALAGIGYGLYRNVSLTESKDSLVFKAGQITRITSSGRVKASVMSPDGKFVIYSQGENNEQQSLWLQHIGSESNVQIAPPADIDFRSLNISPDSNSLYYHDANGTLYRMAVLGGTPKKVADKLFTIRSSGNEKISISPDSKQIAFVRKFEDLATKIFITDADGSNEHILASFEQPNVIFQHSAWSPDGKIIACRFEKIGNFGGILAIKVEDGTSFPIREESVVFEIDQFTWMPDSKSFITNAGNIGEVSKIWQIPFSVGEARQITNDVNIYGGFNLTSDGRILSVLRTEEISQIWTMPTNDQNRLRQLTAGFEKFNGTIFIGWMPDGKIVYDSTISGKLSGWLIEADGSNPRQLLKDAGLNALSPDGRYLAYQKITGLGIWVMDLKDGSEKRLTQKTDVWATFSPDGKWIVYTEYHDRVTILRIPVEGGEPKLIYSESGINPKVSPDGKTVAFITGQKIRLVSFEGGKISKTFDAKLQLLDSTNKQNLQWTLDGRGIYFIALNDGVSNIWRQPVDGSAPVQVTKFETGRIFNFAYSPDGKQLALSRGSLNSDVVLIKNTD